MRTDIRWAEHDPVTQLLKRIPSAQRAHLIRSIVTAALIPGGWAQLQQDGRMVVNVTSTPPADGQATMPPEPSKNEEAVNVQDVTGMSEQLASGFADSLRAAGYLKI